MDVSNLINLGYMFAAVSANMGVASLAVVHVWLKVTSHFATRLLLQVASQAGWMRGLEHAYRGVAENVVVLMRCRQQGLPRCSDRSTI